MGQTRKKEFKSGDLAFVDVLTVAKYDWEFAIEGGNILALKDTVSTFPNILCIIIDVRTTLRVAKIYIPSMGVTIRTPYRNIFELGEIYVNNKKHTRKNDS